MDEYDLFNRFARESRDVAGETRDLTVMPTYLKALPMQELKRRHESARIAIECFPGEIETAMSIYFAALYSEIEARAPFGSPQYRMMDWSPGQWYIFDERYIGQEPLMNELFEVAHEALRVYPYALSLWGKEVAELLIKRIPEYLATRELKSRVQAKASKPVVKRPGYVYLIQSSTGAYKIGRSKNPENRIATFGVLLPFEVEYVCLIKTEDMHSLEKELHSRFGDKRIKQSEWFTLSPADVEYIKRLAR